MYAAGIALKISIAEMNTNKKIVILEGEIDSMSMAQAQGLKWACVSVKTGSQGAKKDLQQQLEWLEQASEIVLMFDSDEAGLKAAWRALQISLKNVFDDMKINHFTLKVRCIWHNWSQSSPMVRKHHFF